MSEKSKKQFGVWMDSHHATVVGREIDNGDFVILEHKKNSGPDGNSNENASNHQEIALTHKFFKEIASTMPNIDEIHVTGTGQIQEQFIKFLADTPQYKNARSTESTSNRMSDEHLIKFIDGHFN
ncbi:MAG: hypothetical protein ABI581_01540 [Sediminibacterium sp.]